MRYASRFGILIAMKMAYPRAHPLSRFNHLKTASILVIFAALAAAPAATAASRTIFAASIVLFLARGWGLMMIPFLVFKLIKVLKIAVEVGLVVGITAAITPMGSAIFIVP